jgi:RNA polymerase sigma-70 factor (sigma-E family)
MLRVSNGMRRSEELRIVDVDADDGDEAVGLEDLYERYAPAAFRLAYLLTGDRLAAEDCVQDAFVRVIGRFGHLRSGVAFDAYLRRTIVNLTKNRWRRNAIERAHAMRSPTPPVPVPPTDAVVVDRITVWRAVIALPVRQRIAIVLRFYEDLAEDDIAAIMRCRPGTVRSLVSRGMAALQAHLEEVR